MPKFKFLPRAPTNLGPALPRRMRYSVAKSAAAAVES